MRAASAANRRTPALIPVIHPGIRVKGNPREPEGGKRGNFLTIGVQNRGGLGGTVVLQPDGLTAHAVAYDLAVVG